MADQSPIHREVIKAAIRIRFGSLSAFENAHGLPMSSVKDLLRGRTSRRTAEVVAGFMGKPVKTLFPWVSSTKADCVAEKPDAQQQI